MFLSRVAPTVSVAAIIAVVAAASMHATTHARSDGPRLDLYHSHNHAYIEEAPDPCLSECAYVDDYLDDDANATESRRYDARDDHDRRSHDRRRSWWQTAGMASLWCLCFLSLAPRQLLLVLALLRAGSGAADAVALLCALLAGGALRAGVGALRRGARADDADDACAWDDTHLEDWGGPHYDDEQVAYFSLVVGQTTWALSGVRRYH